MMDLIKRSKAPIPSSVSKKPGYPSALLTYTSERERNDAFCCLRGIADCTFYPLNAAERRFHSWLDKLSVGHVFIDQQTSSFAAAFTSDAARSLKRPDFVVLPDGRRPYAVDVKEKRLERRGQDQCLSFEIAASDADSLLNFQNRYCMRTWLALTPDSKKIDWYFIDVYHALKLRPSGRYLRIPFTGASQNSAYHETDEEVNKNFFLHYLTKNSPRFK